MGYPQGPVIALAMDIFSKKEPPPEKEEVLDLLKRILEDPPAFLSDHTFGPLAELLSRGEEKKGITLMEEGIRFTIFGEDQIEPGAIRQMHTSSRLPVAVAAALMPDAHQGYGLPIGGVFAAEDAIIPYAVGVDIGCRMCLSIFDIDPLELNSREKYFSRELNEATVFGAGNELKQPVDHEVLENPLFREIPLLAGLRDRAWKQLGTSGSGNHFAEFGIVELVEKDEILGVEKGKYLGLLTHSGSRALGANIANHFTLVAKEKRQLPAEAASLAWLGLEEEEGAAYWAAMNLAGAYASACHDVIHHKVVRQLGRQPFRKVENHHTFAWKEMIGERELIVHRKGATPAGKDVLGIIPGSMTAPGHIVKGKGEFSSLQSASHGAGRKMSRSFALKTVSQAEVKEELAKHGVKLIGGGLDEAPFAYKDINEVMRAQEGLVETVGRFFPKIVKMDSASPKRWRKERILGE